MATYSGTVDFFLRDFGARVRDFTLKESADGDRISRSRAIELLNIATHTLHSRLRRMVNAEVLTRKATLTQSSSDTNVWYLPARATHILYVTDSDTVQYNMVATQLEDSPGVYLQRRPASVGKQLYFRDVSPGATVYAQVMEEPVLMSSGTNAATSATSLTMATSPTVGRIINDANYYANADLCITSGADAGDIVAITASTIAAVCSVAAWTTATPTTTTDTYSLVNSLPMDCWYAISAEAARLNLATDKEIIEFKSEIDAEAQETYMDALMALLLPGAMMTKEPRQTREWVR